nr:MULTISPECIES: sugar O-acetyltransferase [unclassified Enterococcus]
MLNGELYLASDETLRKESQRAKKLLRQINQATDEEVLQRTELFKKLLGQTAESFYIEPPFYCDYGSNIQLGANFYANTDSVMLDVAKIVIGDNVMFGPRVSLFTASHPIDPLTRISGPELGYEILVGDNVWIGGGSIINPGITIGKNTIIGSGSVVTKDMPANVIAAGNPCRVIRPITTEDKEKWRGLHRQLIAEMTENN